MNLYLVKNKASGIVFGTYQGDTPEEAISTMLADAGCDDPPDPTLIATDITDKVESLLSDLLSERGCWPDGTPVKDGDVERAIEQPSTYDMELHIHEFGRAIIGEVQAIVYVRELFDLPLFV